MEEGGIESQVGIESVSFVQERFSLETDEFAPPKEWKNSPVAYALTIAAGYDQEEREEFRARLEAFHTKTTKGVLASQEGKAWSQWAERLADSGFIGICGLTIQVAAELSKTQDWGGVAVSVGGASGLFFGSAKATNEQWGEKYEEIAEEAGDLFEDVLFRATANLFPELSETYGSEVEKDERETALRYAIENWEHLELKASLLSRERLIHEVGPVIFPHLLTVLTYLGHLKGGINIGVPVFSLLMGVGSSLGEIPRALKGRRLEQNVKMKLLQRMTDHLKRFTVSSETTPSLTFEEKTVMPIYKLVKEKLPEDLMLATSL